ncbi:zinc-dependent protease, partial [candidate division WWE3 bacterium CG10_big_fil_rev_8_21_14_0_10_32_10]
NFLNLKYKKIYIKNVKTIWGSCSSRKNLNFNYKLVMAPHNIIDYVVIHEVCHLVHQNHSKSFWSLVKSIDPNFKEHKKWLHENGHNLTL